MDPLEYLNSLNTRRYKCCRGLVHVKKGALLVGVVELFWSSAIVFVFIVDFAVGRFEIPNTVFTIGITCGFVYCSAVILMFYGVRRYQARLFIPHLVIQLLTIVGFVISLGFCIFVFALGYAYVGKDDPERQDSDRSDVLIMTVFIVSCISLVFEIWFMNVVYKCYRYLKAKEKYEKYSNRVNSGLSAAGTAVSMTPSEPECVEMSVARD